jgi:hypothetical protein
MDRRYEEEQVFSAQLDRLLAGDEAPADAAMGDDLKTALDFARRMVSCRAVPSPQFESNLKARLLQKLDEQEDRRESGTGWMAGLIRQPVWQAVAVVVFMVIVGGVVWGSGVFNPPRPNMVAAPTTAPAMATSAPATSAVPATTTAAATAPSAFSTDTAGVSAPARYLAASASTSKSSYKQGEIVNIHLVWQNVSAQTLTIDEFPPILSIMDKSTGQAVYTFQAGKTPITLSPGQTADYTQTWDQVDAKGRQAAPQGYYLELEEMYYQGNSVPLTLTSPVDFNIY